MTSDSTNTRQSARTSRLDIVGLGLATVDILVRLKDMPTWEHGGTFSEFSIDGGGMVATALVAAARLGASTCFLSVAGTDEMGDRKVSSLRERGVDVSRMVRMTGAERNLVICYVHEETGERLFSAMRDFRAMDLTPAQVDLDLVRSASWLHLDGWHFEAALHAAQAMRAAGGSVCYDGGKTSHRGPLSESMRRMIGQVNLLICGSGFVQMLTGRDDIAEAGRAALDLGPQTIVQTEGERGSHTFTASHSFHTPAFPIAVKDTTGAGDVFHGAYLVAMLRGWDHEFAARFATAVSAVKCTRLGGRAGIPTFDETIRFLKERGIVIPRGA